VEPYRSALAGRKPQTIRPGGGHLRPGLFLVADSIGEHHTDYFPTPAGDVVLASVAARAQRIRLGSADINAADWLALIGMNLDHHRGAQLKHSTLGRIAMPDGRAEHEEGWRLQGFYNSAPPGSN
jgi:hypothetical protein